MRSSFAFLVLCSLVPLRAQTPSPSTITVPQHREFVEGNSTGRIAGFEGRSRQQVIVSGQALQAVAGRRLSGFWLRRDELAGLTFPASASSLRVTVSAAGRSTTAPSVRFDQNRGGAPLVVFDGILQLPQSSGAGVPAPWALPHSLRIPFATPFDIPPGDLCIEIEGEPIDLSQPIVWWADYEHEAAVGIVQLRGAGCGAQLRQTQVTANAWERNMVPGATMTLSSVGCGWSFGAMLLGSALAAPVPLGPEAAPGCALHVLPLVQIPVAYGDPLSREGFAFLSVDVQIPPLSSLLSANFSVQWANIEAYPECNWPYRITTTNALDLTLGDVMPPGTISVVVSDEVAPGEPLPDTGRVSVSRGPVLRFDVQ
ncbi:MAG: hypothetical protein AAF628_33190 [Planctomycetota bacterium]